MKFILKAAGLFFCLLAASRAMATPPAGYYLVWSDEFNGSSLDTSKWIYWLPGGYKNGNNTSSAVSVSGGHVFITTYTTGSTQNTAMLSTQGKFHFRYGYVEASVQWADSAGMWSAFWLQSPDMGSFIGDPFTAGAEIDNCEHRNTDGGSAGDIINDVQSNIHWDGYGSSAQSAGSGNYTGSSLGTGFHTYGLTWTSSGYSIAVDGTTKYSTSSGLSGRTEFIVLSSIVDDTDTTWAGLIPSGGYGSLSSSTTKLAVDNVRYYAPTNVVFWTGSASSVWTNSGNWISNMVPGSASEAVFSLLSGNLNMSLGQDLSIKKLTIWETGAFNLGGTNVLTIGSGGVDTVSAWNDATLSGTVSLGTSQTWNTGPGRTMNVNGNLTGTGPLYKSGYGTLVLSGSNSYTGILNADSVSTTANDGAMRITTSKAIANVASPIYIGDNNSANSTLQLDSTGGSVTVNQDISLAGRNSSVAAIEHIGGTTLFTGNLSLVVGGANYWIQSDAGNLNMTGTYPLLTPGGSRTLTFMGAGNTFVTGNIQNGTGGGTVNVAKSGTGLLRLLGSNTFTGTLFVDSGSTSNNDGTVRLLSSAAVAGAAGIEIDNNTSGTSTLALDGSAGNLTIAQAIHLSCRNVAVPAIESLAGNNLLAGDINLTSGGSNSWYQCDNGTLTFGGTLRYIGTLTGSRTNCFQGNGNIVFAGPIIAATNASVISLAKSGAGTMTLAGANTYPGSTTIAGGNLLVTGSLAGGPVTVIAGTLGGSGTIGGPVTVTVSGVLSPTGTLTVNNQLSTFGTVMMDVNKTGGVITNDLVNVLSTLSYAGTLQLNLTGDPLAPGDHFKLFNAGSYNGSFLGIIPAAPPGAGLTWDTSTLAQDGTLRVAGTVTPPLITVTPVSGSSLVLSGSGGVSGAGYSVLMDTNATDPLTNWTLIGTGMFDTNGNYSFTNGMDLGTPQQFFLIRIP